MPARPSQRLAPPGAAYDHLPPTMILLPRFPVDRVTPPVPFGDGGASGGAACPGFLDVDLALAPLLANLRAISISSSCPATAFREHSVPFSPRRFGCH